MVGTRVGPYTVVKFLGEGGMGSVYEARNEQIDKQVAIKILRLDYANTPEIATRFFNEARACNQIEHPGLVQVLDVGQLPTGSLYLVMDYLRGETLEHRLKACTRLVEHRALGLLRQLTSVLTAVHERGIVHRDLKPSNIMLVPDPDMPYGERIKLLDFGIAKMNATGQGPGMALTQTGQPIGTALYMAPEQCRGVRDVDGQADVYSLGVVFFEMLTGQPPFRAAETLTLLNMHVSAPPPSVRSAVPSVSAEIDGLVSRMLSKDRSARPTAAELRLIIEEIVTRGGRPSASALATGYSAVAGQTRQRRTLAVLAVLTVAIPLLVWLRNCSVAPGSFNVDGGGRADEAQGTAPDINSVEQSDLGVERSGNALPAVMADLGILPPSPRPLPIKSPPALQKTKSPTKTVPPVGRAGGIVD